MSGGQPPDLPGFGVKALLRLGLKAVTESPAPLRLLVILPFCGSILAIVLAGGLLAAGSSSLAFVLGVFAFVLLLVALPCYSYVVVRYLALQAPPREQPPGPGPQAQTWARRVPKFPLNADTRDELRQELEQIRNAAFQWLVRRRPTLSLRPDHVRANIFFPDYTRPMAGVAFDLSIPPGLHIGMDGHPDEKISFRPGEGLTGRVFADQDWRVAQMIEGSGGGPEIEERYRLTAEHKKLIHPELRWIVSFALNVPGKDGKRKAAGVLNVDGLTHQVDTANLHDLAGYLLSKVVAVSDKITLIPMVLVSIHVEG